MQLFILVLSFISILHDKSVILMRSQNVCVQLRFGLKYLITYIADYLIIVFAEIMNLEFVLIREAFIAQLATLKSSTWYLTFMSIQF